MFLFILYELVYFVCDDYDIGVFSNDINKGGELLFGINGTCWVAWCVDDEGFCFWCDGRLQLFSGDFEVVFHAAFHDYRSAVA